MSKSRKSVLVILSILTVAASITKILIGLDFDENYITVLGARLLQGDHLFRECRDLYQTTGFTMALGLGIFKGITGGYEGAILFCRIVTAILQLLLGMLHGIRLGSISAMRTLPVWLWQICYREER